MRKLYLPLLAVGAITAVSCEKDEIEALNAEIEGLKSQQQEIIVNVNSNASAIQVVVGNLSTAITSLSDLIGQGDAANALAIAQARQEVLDLVLQAISIQEQTNAGFQAAIDDLINRVNGLEGVSGSYDEDTGILTITLANGEQVMTGDLRGPQGPAGSSGQDGSDGAQGPSGPQGEQGPQGPPGPQGPAGPQGEQGEDGEDGQDGVIPPNIQQAITLLLERTFEHRHILLTVLELEQIGQQDTFIDGNPALLLYIQRGGTRYYIIDETNTRLVEWVTSRGHMLGSQFPSVFGGSGTPGTQGPAGVSITGISADTDSGGCVDFTITFSNGESQVLQDVICSVGASGPLNENPGLGNGGRTTIGG